MAIRREELPHPLLRYKKSMRLAVYSDFHIECGVRGEPPESTLQANVVVLAGDIGSHTHSLDGMGRPEVSGTADRLRCR